MRSLIEDERKQQEIEIGPNETSLDLLRAVYRSNHLPLTTRMRAAISALPHEVPRLAVTAVVSEQDFATVLDRRLKRIEEMKANAIKTTPLIDGEKVDVRLPPVVPDRRFRRI
jgi:hypothetical protein